MFKKKDKAENSEEQNSHEKLMFFGSFFRELLNDETHRMERIENKSARLLSAISIIIVVVGWQFQSNCITQYFDLFTWCVFGVMVVSLLLTWFFFFMSLDFVDTQILKVDKQLIDDILDEKYKLEYFNEHAVQFYGEAVERNQNQTDKKAKKATKASFVAKLTFGVFCLLLLNIFINIIETTY